MESYDLVIGGDKVTLMKSPDVVALRAAGADALPQLGAAARAGHGELLGQRLGGFELVQLDAQRADPETSLDHMRENSNVDVGTHVFYTSNDRVPFVPTGRIYLEFQPDTPVEQANALLDAYKLQIAETRGAHKLIARTTRDSPNPVRVASELQGAAQVKVAEPNLATPGSLSGFVLPVAEPLLTLQWHLRNTGTVKGSAIGLKEGADARVLEAWMLGQTLGSPETIVAVIDNGFDLSHPDLSGSSKVVAPWDFTRNTSEVGPEFNSSYPYFEHGAWQGDWHGSACAGVAVASAQGSGVVGAAPACRLMPIRWGRSIEPEEVERWFDYVTASGAAVVSCSWKALAKDYRLPTLTHQAIARCAREGRGGRGCVIVFAAGNAGVDIEAPAQGTLNGFAVHPDVIAVAASTSRDERAHYSNFGKAIAVCAPSSGVGGLGITTVDVMGNFTRGATSIPAGYASGPYTHDFGGTSSSTPLVAGICALLLSLRPDLSATAVKHVLCQTARKIGDLAQYDANNHSMHFGHGCVDASAAVAAILTLPSQGGSAGPADGNEKVLDALAAHAG